MWGLEQRQWTYYIDSILCAFWYNTVCREDAEWKMCKTQMVKGKCIMVLLKVKPLADDSVMINSYYATLNANISYHKRVSWIV